MKNITMIDKDPIWLTLQINRLCVVPPWKEEVNSPKEQHPKYRYRWHTDINSSPISSKEEPFHMLYRNQIQQVISK